MATFLNEWRKDMPTANLGI